MNDSTFIVFRSTTLLGHLRHHHHSKDFIDTLAINGFVLPQSIPLNIAEGNGKRSLKDLARFLDIARGSALECATIEDVLVTSKGSEVPDDAAMNAMLHQIVAMLTRMAIEFDGVAEPIAGYNAEIDYEYRYAEHEHEFETEETPEPWNAAEWRWCGFSLDHCQLLPVLSFRSLNSLTGCNGRYIGSIRFNKPSDSASYAFFDGFARMVLGIRTRRMLWT